MESNNFENSQFNTLGYHKTTESGNHNDFKVFGLFGMGAEMDNNKLSGWVKRKAIMTKLIPVLIDISEKKKREKKFIKSLWNAFHCMRTISVVNSKIFTSYCKNKVCTICNGIKKAKMINSYLPIIRQWEDPHFVTLTIKSVYKHKLNEYLYKGMNRGFSKILQKYTRKARNGSGKRLIGIKSLECNFNPKKHTYNPHFHVLVPDKETADILVKEWISICDGLAGPYSQKIRKVNDLEADLIEVIKYGTKLFTDPEMKKGKKKFTDFKVYASALENIIYSFKTTKRHSHFGFQLNKKRKVTAMVNIQTEIQSFNFSKEKNNWLGSKDTNTLLIKNDARHTALNQLDNIIDTFEE